MDVIACRSHGLKLLCSSAQVTIPIPSEKSTLSRETEGRKECPHCLPDE